MTAAAKVSPVPVEALRAKVDIDESRWPLLYITWPGVAVSDEEFLRAMQRFVVLSSRAEPYVMIHDARFAIRPTPKQRAVAAEYRQLDSLHTKRWLRGSAIVVSNAVVAGVATALGWINPPNYPEKVFWSIEPAETWVAAQVAR